MEGAKLYMKYEKPKYSRTQVDNAGNKVRKGCAAEGDITVINNWRAAHAWPLRYVHNKLKRNSGSRDVVVAQRLKRL